MPEIISKGPATFKATCRRCGCFFKYRLDELSRVSRYAQGEVACPQCGEQHSHPLQDLARP